MLLDDTEKQNAVIDAVGRGVPLATIASDLGTTRQTIARYQRLHPGFADRVKVARRRSRRMATTPAQDAPGCSEPAPSSQRPSIAADLDTGASVDASAPAGSTGAKRRRHPTTPAQLAQLETDARGIPAAGQLGGDLLPGRRGDPAQILALAQARDDRRAQCANDARQLRAQAELEADPGLRAELEILADGCALGLPHPADLLDLLLITARNPDARGQGRAQALLANLALGPSAALRDARAKNRARVELDQERAEGELDTSAKPVIIEVPVLATGVIIEVPTAGDDLH